MGLFIKQDFEGRTELQNRLAAELQERAKSKPKPEDLHDGVEDSQYIKGTKTTTSLALAWIIILFLSISIAIWLIIISMAR
ncbi:MAG: hypothetical protein WCQ49_01315 [Candidatus Saccharibacteria bacterium]